MTLGTLTLGGVMRVGGGAGGSVIDTRRAVSSFCPSHSDSDGYMTLQVDGKIK